MDAARTGKFIAERRNALGMTQKQLAEALAVSDKTVSKWECGRGLPDIDIIGRLADILDVSLSELCSGESAPLSETASNLSDYFAYIAYTGNLRRKMVRKSLAYFLITVFTVVAVQLITRLIDMPFDVLHLTIFSVIYITIFSLVFSPWYRFRTTPRRSAPTAELSGRITSISFKKGYRKGYRYACISLSHAGANQKSTLFTTWKLYYDLFPGDLVRLTYRDNQILDCNIIERGEISKMMSRPLTAEAVFNYIDIQECDPSEGDIRLARFMLPDKRVISLLFPSDFTFPRSSTSGKLTWHGNYLDTFVVNEPEEAGI